MVRPICLDGDNEETIMKGQGPNRRSRSGTVGRKKRGKIPTESFPSANTETKDEFILP